MITVKAVKRSSLLPPRHSYIRCIMAHTCDATQYADKLLNQTQVAYPKRYTFDLTPNK